MGLLEEMLGGRIGMSQQQAQQQMPYSHLAAMQPQQQAAFAAYGTQAAQESNQKHNHFFDSILYGIQGGVKIKQSPEQPRKVKHVDSVEVSSKNEMVPYKDWEHNYEWF